MATEVEVNPSALEFVSSERRMLVGGDWVDAASGKTFEVFNPATGEVLATSPRAIPRTSTARSRRPAPRSRRALGRR